MLRNFFQRLEPKITGQILGRKFVGTYPVETIDEFTNKIARGGRGKIVIQVVANRIGDNKYDVKMIHLKSHDFSRFGGVRKREEHPLTQTTASGVISVFTRAEAISFIDEVDRRMLSRQWYANFNLKPITAPSHTPSQMSLKPTHSGS